MSDLVKRLREISNSDGVQFEAADRLEALEGAVENFLRVKSRYHTEQAYKRLEEVFNQGVKKPLDKS